MWTFRIRDGALLHDGALRGHGYSGADPDPKAKGEAGEGKNDPSKVAERNVGPLPPGRYRISKPFFHPTAGPYVMRLTPLPGTDTHGRSNFLIHGDSVRNPGTASHGCVVASRDLRMEIGESGDDVLESVAGEDAPLAA